AFRVMLSFPPAPAAELGRSAIQAHESLRGYFAMFSQEAMQAVQRATGILTEMVNTGHEWQIGTAKPYRLRWGMPEHLGLAFDLGQNEVTADKLAWLQERGWIAQVFKDRIILAPLVFLHFLKED